MRTMAGVWFSVIVLVSIQKVFGNVCNDDKIFTCDECIRCNGEWCNERGLPHCKFMSSDNWCPKGREYIEEVVEEPDKKGALISPVYAERNLHITEPNKIEIHYSAVKSKHEPQMTIVHSTQSLEIELKQYEPNCNEATCIATIEVTATREFCNATGGVTESVEVQIDVGLEEKAHIKYFVACACACSRKVERSSPFCNKNGNFSCGVCSCDPGWKGEYCDQPICDNGRGDLKQCSLIPRNDAECSFNGYCGICETCICYTDRDGSQYFHQDTNCQGLCSIASECEDCLIDNTIGKCSKCNHQMNIQPYNESLTKERDAQDRKIWVKCNETFDEYGLLEYFAMRNETGYIFVMILNHINGPAYVANTKVPIILGVLGIIAVVAAVSGIMLWKHMNTVPPVPLNDPQYQNIDAEDCTGENPLYKPPTSSFKNPTYGKW